MSDGLTMSQILHSDIVYELYELGLLNIAKKYFWVPTIQGVHSLDFYALINTKIISSGECDIYPRFVYYCSVQLMVALINWNVFSKMVIHIIELV